MKWYNYIQIERALRAYDWGHRDDAYRLMIPVILDVVKEKPDGRQKPPSNEAPS